MDERCCSDCGRPVGADHLIDCRYAGEVTGGDACCFDCGQDPGDDHLADCQFRGEVR
jgi:hypothetical protein